MPTSYKQTFVLQRNQNSRVNNTLQHLASAGVLKVNLLVAEGWKLLSYRLNIELLRHCCEDEI